MEEKSDKDKILESIEVDAFDLLDRRMGNKAIEQLNKRMFTKLTSGRQ